MKRLVIFSSNSCIYEESQYVLFMLQSIRTCCDEVILCVNEKIEKVLLNKLHDVCGKIYLYETDVDINRWKDIWNREVMEKCSEYDEMIWMNDSVFGPLYPMESILEEMEKEKIDFWGMSVHGRMSLFEKKKRKEYPRFLQSYYLALRNRLFCSNDFKDYMDKLPSFKDINEASVGFEYYFTNYFEKRGYRWKAYVDTKDEENDNPRNFISFILFDLFELVSKRRYPFIPKCIFELDLPTIQRYNLGDEVCRVLNYVTKYLDYDVGYIYQNIVKKLNLYDLITRLKLNYVVCDEKEYVLKSEKYAVFSYLYYEDLFEYSISKLMNVPKCFDIYISTDTEEKTHLLRKELRKYARNNVIVSIYNQRGRDLGALLIGFRGYLMNYDIICCIHDKKSSQMDYVTVGKGFYQNLWENTLHSREYIYSVIKKLEENEYLGLLTPPMVYHNAYFHTSINSWTICYTKTVELASKLGIQINIDENKNPISLGSVFWCKTKGLKRIFEYEFTSEDFPEEPMDVDGTISHAIERVFPYVAQQEGYYSGTIMTKDSAELHISNYSEMLNLILKEIDVFKNVDTTTCATTVFSLKNLKVRRNRTEKN